MAIAYVGERASQINDTTGQTSVTVTFTSGTTAGNLLLVLYGASSGSLITGAVTDARGNTWYTPSGLQASVSGANGTQIIYTFQDVTAYTTGDTISFSVLTTPGHTLVKAEEFSGVADVATTHDDGRAASIASSTISIIPGNAGDLIVYQVTSTETGGWVPGTIGGTTVDGSGSVVSATATQRTLGWEYLLSGGSGTLSASSTAGTSPATVAVAFQPSAAGVTVTQVYPDADNATGGWTTAPLWSKVNDPAGSPDGVTIQATSA